MDDLWTAAARAHVAVALTRLIAAEPDRRNDGHLRVRLACLDRDVLLTLAVRSVVADAEALLAKHAGDSNAAFEDALARYSAAHALALDLHNGPPDHLPDTWPNHRPPVPAGADDLREDITMTVLNKNTTTDGGPAGADQLVPNHLKEAYARTGGRAYWRTIERARLDWRERTPEHAQTPDAWAAEEHKWRLAEAERIVLVDKESAERMAAYEASRRCYCCGDEYRDSIHDEIGPRCRAVLHAQQATEYSTAVLSSGTRRDQAVAHYRTVRGK